MSIQPTLTPEQQASEWRHWRGRYWVDSEGHVFSEFTGRVLKPTVKPIGRTGSLYWHYSLSVDGERLLRRAHVLVLEAWVGPRPPGYYGCHVNGDSLDNRLENLIWGTPKMNAEHDLMNGANYNVVKTHCRHGHPFDAANTRIERLDGRNPRRVCRTCQRAAGRAYRQRKAAN